MKIQEIISLLEGLKHGLNWRKQVEINAAIRTLSKYIDIQMGMLEANREMTNAMNGKKVIEDRSYRRFDE